MRTISMVSLCLFSYYNYILRVFIFWNLFIILSWKIILNMIFFYIRPQTITHEVINHSIFAIHSWSTLLLKTLSIIAILTRRTHVSMWWYGMWWFWKLQSVNDKNIDEKNGKIGAKNRPSHLVHGIGCILQ